MNKSLSITIILIFSICSVNNSLKAQTQTLTFENEETGDIIYHDSKLILYTDITRDSISDNRKLAMIETDSVVTSESKSGKKYQASKYIIGESAYGLKKGQTMYQNTMGGINTFGFGISDNFTLNLSTEIFSLLSGQAALFQINPKFTFGKDDDNIRFGIGSNLFLGFIEDEVGTLGTTYGLITIGSEYKNLTAGVGIAYSFNDEISGDSPAIFQLGGTLYNGAPLTPLMAQADPPKNQKLE